MRQWRWRCCHAHDSASGVCAPAIMLPSVPPAPSTARSFPAQALSKERQAKMKEEEEEEEEEEEASTCVEEFTC